MEYVGNLNAAVRGVSSEEAVEFARAVADLARELVGGDEQRFYVVLEDRYLMEDGSLVIAPDDASAIDGGGS